MLVTHCFKVGDHHFQVLHVVAGVASYQWHVTAAGPE
jgi:hypothetical protein